MARGVTIRPNAIEAYISQSHTRAHRDLIKRADRVVGLAKQYVPVDTGRLKSSIGRSKPYPAGNGLTITIFAQTDYAAAVHEGRRSKYRPPSWSKRGPGPRRFLTNALAAAGGTVRKRRR